METMMDRPIKFESPKQVDMSVFTQPPSCKCFAVVPSIASTLESLGSENNSIVGHCLLSTSKWISAASVWLPNCERQIYQEEFQGE
jgi:hypothetical protein